MSAAAFFNNDYPISTNPLRSHSTRSSEIDQQPMFHYPPALSESVSEDAVIDDLLGARVPQYPTISTPSPSPRATPNQSDHHQHSTKQSKRAPARSSLLPALTRKRRSLWQWLFCSDQAAASTTVPSVAASPLASSRQRGRAADRVPGADKDFLIRAQKAKDAPKPKKRSPSFELRRGKPERETPRRSMSWTFVPKALLGREQKRRKPPSTKPIVNENVLKENKLKKSKKKKDRPRGLVVEELDEGRSGGRLAFAKAFKGLDTAQVKRNEGRRDVVRAEGEKPKRHQDRPREDRPRRNYQSQSKENVSVAPVQKSVVPSLREKKGVGSMPGLTQRMRSADSSDPVTSRISSDLSSTLERSMGSRSGNSTPVHMKTYQGGGHEFDPAANGVSSDVSSHENSGLQSKSSPDEQVSVPEDPEPPIGPGGIDFSTINAARASRNPPPRSELFAFPSSSTESGGFFGPSDNKSWENSRSAYPEYANAENLGASTSTEADATTFDPVVRALEKNRSRSAGGPLSYLMPEQDLDMDADTQSTGLTSLADESVSTHKTVSAVGEDYPLVPSSLIKTRYQRGDPTGNAKQLQEHRDDQSDSSGSVQAHIFKNSALFSINRSFSPSRLSNASPRRFHSDWSDPHATDIERFCQCGCDCVYEEECRRTCELVYGRRSPSVSSTRSHSRRGGFQSLSPEAEDTELSSRRKRSVTQSSDAPALYTNGRNVNSGAAEESAVYSERRYAQVPGADESFGSCSYRGKLTSSPYDPAPSDDRNYDMRKRRIHRNEENNYESDKNCGRVQQYKDRPRGERRDGNTERGTRHYRNSSKPSHSSWTRTQQSDATRTTRKQESRHLNDFPQDAGTSPKEQRSRPSSRNTSSSRQSSGNHKEHYGNGRGRHGESSGASAAERKRREMYERKKYGNGEKRLDGAQQMGNSYVLKRDGPPPFNQSNYPQPYKAGGYDKDFDYEFREQEDIAEGSGTKRRTRDTLAGPYDLHSSVARDSVPVVELEYDEKRMGSPDVYRRSDGARSKEKGRDGRPRNGATRLENEKRKGVDNGRRSTRRGTDEPHHNTKRSGETRSSAKPTPRHHAKGNNHGRAPLFGIF